MNVHVDTNDMTNAEDSIALDPETLDPSMHYRWGYASEVRMSRLMSKGYVPVRRSEDGVKTMLDNLRDKEDESADDYIRNGDLILFQKPKEAYDRTVRMREQLTSTRLKSPEHQFEEKARRASGGLSKPVRVIGKDKEDES